MLAAAVNENMHVHQMDVTSAYVQGELNDEVYMEQPENYVQQGMESKVCKLLKPLYGLKQSGRYNKIRKVITSKGGTRAAADPCVYTFGEGDRRVVMIYVDDLILASKSIKELEFVKMQLKSEFKIVDLGAVQDVLGINIKREGQTGSMFLSQKKYVQELLKKFNMENVKTVSTPLEPNTKITKKMCPKTEAEHSQMKNRPYRELVGALNYLANATRPDIAFAASTLSRFCANPGKMHWILAKRVLRYLNKTLHYGIKYSKNDNKVAAYTDSDWAGDTDDRRSRTGNVVMLANGPVSWKTKKQTFVALSTMEAEYGALAEVSREIVYIKKLLKDTGFEKLVSDPITVFCDNQSAIELSKNVVLHKRSKHIDIKLHFTRELVVILGRF